MDGGWSQGYYSLLISHQVPQDAPNKRAPGLTSGFSLSHGGSSSGWLAFSPVADGMQGQGAGAGTDEDGGPCPLSIGVGHLRLTLAHCALRFGFLSFLLLF